MSDLNPVEVFERIKGNTIEAISAHFPYVGKKHRLDLLSIQVVDDEDPSGKFHIDNVPSQYAAKTVGGSWEVPIKAKLRLVDIPSGKTVDETTVTLAKLPKMTRRYSFIIKGHERQHDSTFRLKSRPFHLTDNTGNVVARWNLAKGLKFDLDIQQKTRKIQMFIGTSHVPLYPLLKLLGISDQQMESAWGKELFAVNRKFTSADLAKLHKTLYSRNNDGKYTPPPLDVMEADIRKAFDATRTRPDAMAAAFGQPFDRVTGENLLLSTQRLIGIMKGTEQEDDRRSLSSKDLASTEDYIAEFLEKRTRDLQLKVKNNLDRKEKITDILGARPYSKVIYSAFEDSQRPEQTNPVTFIMGHMKTTMKGAYGGVQGDHSLSDADKMINPSHLGFLDPVSTPESADVGVAVGRPLNARKSGQDMTLSVYDMKTKMPVDATPAMLEKENVAFADQVTWENGHPKPRSTMAMVYDRNRQTSKVPWSEVRYVLRSSKGLFSVATNLIPFLGAVQGNRAMMGSKYMEQAVSLVHREAPLVQAKTEGDFTFEQFVGNLSSAHRSPAEGVVTKVTPNEIQVKDDKGKVWPVYLYNHYPLNGVKTMLHSDPVVKVGDRVKAKQLLADTNYSKGGALALGTNIRVAYIPYAGLNFEDGIVISESAAKQLTSQHLYVEQLYRAPGVIIDRKRWMDTAIPERKNPENIKYLTDAGVIREGAPVRHGTVLVAAIAPAKPTKDEMMLGNISRSLVRENRDAALLWDHDAPGVVVKVIMTEDKVFVHVRTEEPTHVGDKLSGRFGNKGIVSRILADHEMPHDKEGNPAHMLLNPAGVVSRINVGQVYETAVSKIARKTGKPYVVDNFKPGLDHGQEVKDALKAHGLSDTEELFDAKTGKSLGKILVGEQFITKLHHQVDKKITARSHGGQYDPHGAPPSGSGIPGGGSKIDQLTTYAMLAHGLPENLRETFTYKSDADSGDVWTAIQLGHPIPPPKPARVVGHLQNYMRAMGSNVSFDGRNYNMMPMTDAQTKALSNGSIKFPDKLLKAKGKLTLEEAGGLFDRKITGGIGEDGKFWSHIDLPTRMPNPLFEPVGKELGPICSILGISAKEYEQLVGPDPVNGRSGFDILNERLAAINVPTELAKTEAEIKTATGPALQRLHRKRRYLQAVQKLGITPLDAYTHKMLPVLPPNLRRVSIDPSGDHTLDDLNQLYATVGMAKMAIEKADPKMPLSNKQRDLATMYDAIRALKITGSDKGEGGAKRHHRGLMELLSSDRAKTSFYQEHVISRRQDMSARSTIIPLPELSLNEVGLPQPMALELYKPFIVKELHTQRGYAPREAQNMVKTQSPVAVEALQRIAKERPLLMKRDPALHKYSLMAFHPKIIPGKAIGIHPLITGNLGADFDGNCYVGGTQLTVKIRYNAPEGDFTDVLQSLQEAFPMKFAADTQVIYSLNGEVVVETTFDQLPYFAETGHPDKNGAVVYQVPEGLQVWSYDHATGQPIWADVTELTIEEDCEVASVGTRGEFGVIGSTNESLCVYDHETEEVRDQTPAGSVGMLVPILRKLPSAGVLGSFEDGWAVGSFASDGSLLRDTGVSLSKEQVEIRDRFFAALGHGATRAEYSEYHDASNAVGGRSVKEHFFRLPAQLLQLFAACLEKSAPADWRAAYRKRLPPGLAGFSREFLLGVLTGMLEGDGSLSVSRAKARPQVMASIASSSDYMVSSLRELCLLLGIRMSVTTTPPSAGRLARVPAHTVTLSIVDLRLLLPEMQFSSGQYQEAIDLLWGSRGMKDDRDIVPVPARLMKLIASQKGPCAVDTALVSAATSAKSERKPFYYLSRSTARRALALLQEAGTPGVEKWATLVCATDVHWDVIVKAEVSGRERVYDLVVPLTKVFAVNGGMVVWDTVALFAPISPAAVDEAKKILPSRLLFSSTHGRLNMLPGQDSLLGLYQLSAWGKENPNVPKTLPEMENALKAKKILASDVFTHNGKKTTVGRYVLAQKLPMAMRNHEKLLYDPAFRLTNKGVESLFVQVAKDHANEYGPAIDAWKDWGNHWSYMNGSSFSVHDFHDGKGLRDEILKPYKKKEDEIRAGKGTQAQKEQQIVDLYRGAMKELEDRATARYKEGDNRVYEWAASGARGKWTQFGQIVVGPTLVKDNKGNVVPLPVTKSFGEGLPIAEYWATMHGARGGAVDRAKGTSEPGALAKDIINTMMPMQITAEDCGTTNGITMAPDASDVVGRFLAQPVQVGAKSLPAKTELTPSVLADLKKAGVTRLIVRSPLRCAQVRGICAMCHGHNESGQLHTVGTNVGVIAGQSMSEPMTQIAMKTRHTGGVVEAKKGLFDVFAHVKRLLEVPEEVPHSAVLSTVAGTVDRIEKDQVLGGYTVYVDGKKHVAKRDLDPVVKKGDVVTRGQVLTEGVVNPRELLSLTGNIHETRQFLAGALSSAYGEGTVRRRNIETVVRGMTSLAHVTAPGSHPDWMRGNTVPLAEVEEFNRTAKERGHELVHATPLLRPIDRMPHEQTEDWMARLNYNRLEATYREGAAQGWTSDIHGHPIPGLVHGAEFGRKHTPPAGAKK